MQFPTSPNTSKLTQPEVAQTSTKHRIDEPMDETLVLHMREVLNPYIHPSSRNCKRYLLDLIGEYIREEMTLKRFFKELRAVPSPLTQATGELYRWLIQLIICTDKDPTCKVMSFLLENGVDESDIEFGSVKRLLSMCHNDEQGDKKVCMFVVVLFGYLTRHAERAHTCTQECEQRTSQPSKQMDQRRKSEAYSVSERLRRQVMEENCRACRWWKNRRPVRYVTSRQPRTRTHSHSAQHWKRVLCPVIRKGSWDDTEELKLFQLVEKYGQSWKNIASEIGTRTGMLALHCREYAHT